MPKTQQLLTELVAMRVTLEEAARIDNMVIEGKWGGRAQLCRSLILAILDDDDRAHGKTRKLHA